MAITKRKALIDGGGEPIDPNAVYVCAESFAGVGIAVRRGDRLRGGHELVARFPAAFLPDGADRDQVHRARVALFGWDEPPPAEEHGYPKATRHLGPRGAVVAIRATGPILSDRAARMDGRELGVNAGQRLPRGDERVKADPSAFVPVLPAEVDANSAVICRQRCDHSDDGGGTALVVEAGQIVPRSHALVRMNAGAFEPLSWPDFDELASK